MSNSELISLGIDQFNGEIGNHLRNIYRIERDLNIAWPSPYEKVRSLVSGEPIAPILDLSALGIEPQELLDSMIKSGVIPIHNDKIPRPSLYTHQGVGFLIKEQKTNHPNTPANIPSAVEKFFHTTPKGPVSEPTNAEMAEIERDVLYNENQEPENLDINSIYFSQIGRGPLLTFAQELKLGNQIQTGLTAAVTLEELVKQNNQTTPEYKRLQELVKKGTSAKDILVEKNLRLVISLARKYLNHGLALEDLIQEGNIGLMRAAEKYHPDKGWRFSTYAFWWIKQGIQRAIADQSRTIRIPVHEGLKINALSKVTRKLGQTLGRQPTIEEISEETGLSIDNIATLLNHPQTNSLNQKLDEDGELTLGDSIADQSESVFEKAAHSEQVIILQNALALLKPNHREVLSCRFGIRTGTPMTLTETGKVLGVTRERIRQLEVNALNSIRRNTYLYERLRTLLDK